MENSILIIHFRSATDYPPVYNFTRFMAIKGVSVTLVTGKRKESAIGLKDYGVDLKEVEIEKGWSFGNYFAYFFFYLKAFTELLKNTKAPIIYFESISSPPVFLYFLLFPLSKRSLSIHYHEYFDKEELNKQSFLERLGRKLELNLFKRASWISHTNKDRLKRFNNEFKWIEESILYAMPNYPPKNWLINKKVHKKRNDGPTKLVYVGSISSEGLFLKELLQWLKNREGKVTCDIYTKYISEDVVSLIRSQPQEVVTYKGNLAYDDLPLILPQYDVGLILYNSLSSSNFIYNAPNKLFEYLACDIDVWLSNTLISSYEYETMDTYPKVVKVDFTNLETFDYKAALSHDGLIYKKSTFVMETVYEKFYQVVLLKS
jgi:hypothetical protein